MAAWLDLTTQVFHQWQCDHFGHVNTRSYAAVFDDAVFLFWSHVGGREADSAIPVTAELKTTFHSEAVAGTVVRLRGQVARVGGKSVTARFEMRDAASGVPVSSCEAVEVFFDRTTRSSTAIPERIRTSLQVLMSRANG